MIKYLAIILLFSISTPSGAGFISSNGMGLPIGVVCQEDEISQIQIKLDDELKYYTVRRVQFEGTEVAAVQNLSNPVSCQTAEYNNEPTIENRCFGVDGDQESKLMVIPFRQRIHILLKNPAIEDQKQLWFDFLKSDCHIVLNDKIMP